MNGKLNLHPKVAGGGLASSAAVLIVYILSLDGVTVPSTAAAALATVLGGVGAWLAPILETPPSKP